MNSCEVSLGCSLDGAVAVSSALVGANVNSGVDEAASLAVLVGAKVYSGLVVAGDSLEDSVGVASWLSDFSVCATSAVGDAVVSATLVFVSSDASVLAVTGTGATGVVESVAVGA